MKQNQGASFKDITLRLLNSTEKAIEKLSAVKEKVTINKAK